MSKLLYTNLIFILFLSLSANVWAQKSEAQTAVFRLSKTVKLPMSKGVRVENVGGRRTFFIENIAVTLTKPEPFIAFSMRLDGLNLTDKTIAVSYLDGDSKLWLPLEKMHDADGDNTDRWVSELLFLDKNLRKISVKIELKARAAKARATKIRFFSAGVVDNSTGNSATNPRTESLLAACDLPPSVPRTVWGAGLGLSSSISIGTPTITTVTHLIVHHSDGPNTSVNWAATVASIWDYHVNTNGWSDVGYNWLVAPSGQLFVGRGSGNNVVGAHYCSKNGNTMGVCMMGTYINVPPTDTSLRTLERLLAWKCLDSGINPTATAFKDGALLNTITGHRSGCATDCPGDQTWNLLPTIRQNVAQLVAACRTGSVEIGDVSRLKIYPNPSDGSFTVEFDKNLTVNAPLSISVADVSGRIVFRQNFAETSTVVRLPTEVTSGFYTLQVQADNLLFAKKLTVRR